MAIKTSTFGGVTLTGNAAKVFKKQFLGSETKVNLLAQTALNKGRKMLKEYKEKGYITVKG